MHIPYTIIDYTLTPKESLHPYVLDAINAPVLALGEEHEKTEIVAAFKKILAQRCELGLLKWVAVEYFNVKQQSLLDKWLQRRIDWKDLVREYSKGPEGFNLEVYKPILETARACNVRIVGVMPPRTEANRIARGGEPRLKPCLPIEPSLYRGYSEDLKPLFPRSGPMARIPLEKLLLAQSYKDSLAACTVYSTLREYGAGGVLIMGWAHIEPRGSVPDRVELLSGMRGLVWRIVFRSGREIRGEERGSLLVLGGRMRVYAPGF